MGKRSRASYFTAPKANAGVRVYVPDPLTGDDSEDWILVLGTDSTAVRDAITAQARARAGLPDGEAGQEAPDHMDLLVAAIPEWSFEDPITPELVKETLTLIPGLYDKARAAMVDRRRFFGETSEPLSSSPNEGLNSTESQEVPLPPSENS